MFDRLLLIELENWAANSDRKPLIIRGARQVGKTTLVNQFAGQFKQYIYLNLELPEDRKPFEQFKTVETLLQTLFFLRNLPLSNKKETLLFKIA